MAELWVCGDCGAEYSKWEGRCRSCGAWNTLAQFRESKAPGRKARPAALVPTPAAKVPLGGDDRFQFALPEINQLFGGGWAKGSVYLLSGEPGVGKSTLLLQLASSLPVPVLYVCGEETPSQVNQRAARLGIDGARLHFVSETGLGALEAVLSDPAWPVVFIDSVQTLTDDSLPHPPGSAVQLRACAQRLVTLAKETGKTMLLTGHITKGGEIAGPKLLEHVVDGTLLMESEEGHGLQDLRVIRPLKNRFGPTDTAAVFILDSVGLRPTQERVFAAPDAAGGEALSVGTAFYPHFLGKRIFFSEIEALGVASPLALPRRSAEGVSPNRLGRLVAVLERYTGLSVGNLDLYVNVTGGVRNEDVAMDLAILAALYSAVRSVALPRTLLFLGEVGLNGRIRPVRDAQARLRELEPWGSFRAAGNGDWAVHPVKLLGDLVALVNASAKP
ncbi:MAG: DNA repair protein RadA [Spirochaetes bacterium]|nr:DNA repair protein RadA [Spirochaetota bacterium]